MLAIVNGAPSYLPICDIEVGERTRSLSPANVEKIRASIAEVGLINPILVIRGEAALKLCAGRHRLEAAKALGWEKVPVRIVTTEHEAEAILAEIDENLAREELSPVEFATNVRAREEAFLELKSAEHGRVFKTLAELQIHERALKGVEARSEEQEGQFVPP